MFENRNYCDLIALIRSGDLADEIIRTDSTREDFKLALLADCYSGWVVQKKYDGWFAFVTPDGIYSKTGRLINTDIKTIGDVILMGEYINGTQWAMDSKDKGRVIVFESSSPSDPLPDGCRWIEDYTREHAIANLDLLLDGFEGLVLKNKSTGEFLRYKKQFNFDYVLMDCLESTAKTLQGRICSSVQVGLFKAGALEPIMRVSGFDHEIGAEMFEHPERFIGRVIEVSGAAMFKSGALRHPMFSRFRDDKKAQNCKIELSTFN